MSTSHSGKVPQHTTVYINTGEEERREKRRTGEGREERKTHNKETGMRKETGDRRRERKGGRRVKKMDAREREMGGGEEISWIGTFGCHQHSNGS